MTLTRIAVTWAGLVGWGLALWLTIRYRHTRRVPLAHPPGAPRGERLAASAARVAGSLAGAMVAGALVLGLGGRLMMRVLAATSPASVQGVETDAQEIVGRVTVGGTVGLVMFVGLFGGMAGLGVFAALRRWLPERSVAAGLVTAGAVAAPFALMSDLLNPDNRDFAILTPRWLAVALALGLIVTFALATAVLVDRWAPRWPRPSRSSPAGMAALLPVLPTVLVPPVAVLVAAAVGVGAQVSATPGGGTPTTLDRSVAVAIRVVAVAGTVWLLALAADILSG